MNKKEEQFEVLEQEAGLDLLPDLEVQTDFKEIARDIKREEIMAHAGELKAITLGEKSPEEAEAIKEKIRQSAKAKISFVTENYESLKQTQNNFKQANSLDEVLAMQKEVSDLLGKAQKAGVKKEVEAFRFIVGQEAAEKISYEQKSHPDYALYLPAKGEREGADSWGLKQENHITKAYVMDGGDHGYSHFYKKVFLDKLLSYLSDQPEREEVEKIDSAMETIDGYRPHTTCTASLVKAEVEKLDNERKRANFMIMGDCDFLYYNPEENNVYSAFLNTGSTDERFKSLDLKVGAAFGQGIIKVPQKYQVELPEKAEIILFSDGLLGDKNHSLLMTKIRDFLDQKDKKNSLFEEIKNFVISPEFEQDDDVTVLEVK